MKFPNFSLCRCQRSNVSSIKTYNWSRPLLGVISFGIRTCWMANINAKKIREMYKIPEYYDIKQIISLGVPDEESTIFRSF